MLAHDDGELRRRNVGDDDGNDDRPPPLANGAPNNDDANNDDANNDDANNDANNDAAPEDPNARLHELVRIRREALNQRMAARRSSFLLRNYTLVSFLALLLLLWYAFRTHSSQFYPSVLFVTTSKLSYVVIGNAVAASSVDLFGRTARFWLGGLRDLERETVSERMRWGLTETCLALTMFRQEITVKGTAMFLALVLGKGLHWAVDMRGKHLGQTEELLTIAEGADGTRRVRARASHVKFFVLAYALYLGDLVAVWHCATECAENGPSVHILFGFEAAVLSVSASTTLGLYCLHALDSTMQTLVALWADDGASTNGNRGAAAGEAAEGAGGAAETDSSSESSTIERLAAVWKERRGTYTLTLDLLSQAAKFLCYLLFFAIVFTYYGMPINIFRELYISYQELRRKISAFMSYWRLSRDLDTKFETVRLGREKDDGEKKEEGDGDNAPEQSADSNTNDDDDDDDEGRHTCIICRETMIVGKKLPGCGHVFHAYCLKGWLMQQRTCPTCRSDISAAVDRCRPATTPPPAANAAPAPANGDDATRAPPSLSSGTACVVPAPTVATAATATAFPCLYRVTNTNAPTHVWRRRDDAAVERVRSVADSVIIVCTRRAWWPGSIETASETDRDAFFGDRATTAKSSAGLFMLEMPDGWVRERDVTRMAALPAMA